MRVCSVILLYCLLELTEANENSNFTLENDGPAILDSRLTFYASIDDPDYEHEFYFEDNTHHRNSKIVLRSQNASYSYVYKSSMYAPGHYSMKVTVSRINKNKPKYIVATGETKFELSEMMVGKIIVHQDDTEDEEYYASNKYINFTAVIHDPSGYFDNKQVSYSWFIDNNRYADVGNSIVHNFTKGGKYEVSTTVVAYDTNLDDDEVRRDRYRFKWGYFTTEITIIEPIETINVTGNTWLKHGDLLSINISCDGSGPSYEYCWEIVPQNETENNLTCSNPIVTTTCSFIIVRYFSDVGSYFIKTFISNYISHQEKTVEVRIYDVSRKPQLSTVIIPIVCSVLTLVIIIMGVAYHIQQRKQYAIEVADFDFHQSENLVEKTFFERLHESFKIALCRTNQQESGECEEKPLCD